MGYMIDELLMLFAVYSILGWIINVSIYNLLEGRFDHRSICKGPYAASFGIGAMTFLACSEMASQSIISVFGMGVVVGLLIQVTAALLIKAFCGQWLVLHRWYYIPMFGIAGVLLYYQVNPLVLAITNSISPWIRLAVLLVFWMNFIPDVIDGIAKMTEFRKKANIA